MRLVPAGGDHVASASAQHVLAQVEAGDPGVGAVGQLEGDAGRTGGHIEHSGGVGRRPRGRSSRAATGGPGRARARRRGGRSGRGDRRTAPGRRRRRGSSGSSVHPTPFGWGTLYASRSRRCRDQPNRRRRGGRGRTRRQHGGPRARSGRCPGGAGRQGDVRPRQGLRRPRRSPGAGVARLARSGTARRPEGRRDGGGRAHRATGASPGPSGTHLSRPRRGRHPPALRRLAARRGDRRRRANR